MNTAYHAKLFAHDLSLVQAGDSVNRLSHAMFDACIDLNPHQINAAIFALKNPLSKGTILADEVGLGKTIETGLILSQLRAEGKKSFLIIAPKSLRHQWKEELSNLFFLDSDIMSGLEFKNIKNNQTTNPFNKKEKIIITNEHSVDSYHELIKSIDWDLVIIDEAHKLRNVWKKGLNEAKRAKRIKDAIQPFKKLLLTATPMQNHLMELYGLTSYIDEYILGTADNFQSLFCNLSDSVREERMIELQSRMKGFFRRELRKNVLEYINYTNRNTVTFTYDPTDYEEELRVSFENFLRRPLLVSIPASALPLLTLVYLKLIASSTFAIKNSLLNLYKRLVLASVSMGDEKLYNLLVDNITTKLTQADGKKSDSLERFEKVLFGDVSLRNYEGLKKSLNLANPVDEISTDESELRENYSDQDIEDSNVDDEQIKISAPELVLEEAGIVLSMIVLSLKIDQNKKADALVDALKKQFEKARTEGWPEKAVIFTEFRSTQDYILKKLSEMGIEADRDVVIFNGDSGDAESRRLLVKQFKEQKKIFLTTEAGSEGLNLQFCNLLINYDLPWNPQRIEQRIGRCHRYGQKLDVIVVNFVNSKNIADRRVLELLQEKFNLFKGAFGASDEVLGDIEDGHDVEKEILKIYLSCRTEDEINAAFTKLQLNSQEQISETLKETKNIVLKQFDEDVHSKLKLQLEDAEKRVDSISKMFWSMTKTILNDFAKFDDVNFVFNLTKSPFSDISLGEYRLGQYKMISKGKERDEDFFTYRLGHPLGVRVIDKAKQSSLEVAHLQFDLTSYENKISGLEPYRGSKGWFCSSLASVEALDNSESILISCVLDDGKELPQELSRKMFNLNATNLGSIESPSPSISDAMLKLKNESMAAYLKEIQNRNNSFFIEESDKLDKWSDDIKEGLEIEIKNLDKEIRKLQKESKEIATLEEKVKAQRTIKNLEKKRNDKRRTLFEEQDRIESEKDKLIEDIERRMELVVKENEIFKIRWEII